MKITTAIQLLTLSLSSQLTMGAPTASPGTSPNHTHELHKREYYLNCSFGMIYICLAHGTVCVDGVHPYSNDQWSALNCECQYAHDCCVVAGHGGGIL